MAQLWLTFLLIGSTWAELPPSPFQAYNSPPPGRNPINNAIGGFAGVSQQSLTSQDFGNGPANSFSASATGSVGIASANFDRGNEAGFSSASPIPPSGLYNGPASDLGGPADLSSINVQNRHGSSRGNPDVSFVGSVTTGTHSDVSGDGFSNEFSSGFQNDFSAARQRSSSEFSQNFQQGFSGTGHDTQRFSDISHNPQSVLGNAHNNQGFNGNGRHDKGLLHIQQNHQGFTGKGLNAQGISGNGFGAQEFTDREGRNNVYSRNQESGLSQVPEVLRPEFSGTASAGYNEPASSQTFNQRVAQNEVHEGLFREQTPVINFRNEASPGIPRPTQVRHQNTPHSGSAQRTPVRAIGGKYNGDLSGTLRSATGFPTGGQEISTHSQSVPSDRPIVNLRQPEIHRAEGSAYFQRREQGSFGTGNAEFTSGSANGAQGTFAAVPFDHSIGDTQTIQQQTATGSHVGNFPGGDQDGNGNEFRSAIGEDIIFHGPPGRVSPITGSGSFAAAPSTSRTPARHGSIGSFNNERPSGFFRPTTRHFQNENSLNDFNASTERFGGQTGYNGQRRTNNVAPKEFGEASFVSEGPTGGVRGNGQQAIRGFDDSQEDHSSFNFGGYGK